MASFVDFRGTQKQQQQIAQLQAKNEHLRQEKQGCEISRLIENVDS